MRALRKQTPFRSWIIRASCNQLSAQKYRCWSFTTSAHQARQHAEQVPEDADAQVAERRALVALAITQLAQQQWHGLVAAAHGDEMLVHDHVTALALACDWCDDSQLMRLTEDILIPAHWHRRVPAELWQPKIERAFQQVAQNSPAAITPPNDPKQVQALVHELTAACAALPSKYLDLLDDYVWHDGMVVCRRPIQNIGGYLRRTITRAAAQQRQQSSRENSDPEWFDQSPTSDRQTGFMAELCDALRSLPSNANTTWPRDATAWLLQGQAVYREEADQKALQQEYLGQPDQLAGMDPAQALAQVAAGLAQAYEDLWLIDFSWRHIGAPTQPTHGSDDRPMKWAVRLKSSRSGP